MIAVTVLVLTLVQLDPAQPAAPAGVAPPPPAAAPEQPVSREATSTPPPSQVGKPVLWGFIDAQVSRTNAPGAVDTSTFELRRARIGARGDVIDGFGYNVLFDAADTSLKDAYVAWKGVRGLELRVGQWKTPFGYEQRESDTRLLWVNSSLVIASLARGVDSRDLGVGFIGGWSIAGPLLAELSASLVNGAGPNRRDDLTEKNAWGRAGARLNAGTTTLRVGGSYGYGRQVRALGANGRFDGVGTPADDTYFWFHTYGADLTLDTPWFFLAAELIQSERDVTSYTSPTSYTHAPATSRGWYAGAYGKTPWNLGPVFRAEQLDPSRSTVGDLGQRYTLGAYLDLLAVKARLILNYEFDESQSGFPGRPGNRAIVFAQAIF